MNEYICPRCHGTGQVICSGHVWDDYKTTCERCSGTGKLLTERPLEEYENLKEVEKAFKIACAAMSFFTGTCPLDLATQEPAEEIAQICLGNNCDNDIENCWQEYFLMKAREKDAD